jgi:hypothetical protein
VLGVTETICCEDITVASPCQRQQDSSSTKAQFTSGLFIWWLKAFSVKMGAHSTKV